MTRSHIYFWFLICLWCFQVKAQTSNWSLQIAWIPGQLLKHTEKMLFDPKGHAHFFESQFAYQTTGKYAWEQFYGLPRYGIGLRFLDLGQPQEILGNGLAIYPYIDFSFLNHKNYSFQFLIACGLAYLDTPYDIKRNSRQTAIGSHWNNHTSFQLRFEHHLQNKQSLFLGAGISHLSNGAFKSPNLGLNYVSALIGIAFNTQKPAHFERLKKMNPSLDKIKDHLSFQLEWGATWKETRIPNGPKYLINFGSIDLGYQYNAFKSWRLIFDLENNHLASYFSDYTETRDNKKNAAKDGLRFNVYGGHQWLFGSVSLTLKAGYQFLRKISLDDYPVVTKLDLCYLVPYALLNRSKFYTGISLKTHFGTAEYIGVMVGLRFDHYTNN